MRWPATDSPPSRAANSVAHDPALTPGVSLTTASAAGGAVTVAALAVAVRKLASFSLCGDAA